MVIILDYLFYLAYFTTEKGKTGMFYILIDRNNNVVSTQATEWSDARLVDNIIKVDTGVYGQPSANWVNRIILVDSDDTMSADITDEILDLVLNDFMDFGETIPNFLLANKEYAELARDKILAAHDGEGVDIHDDERYVTK